MRKRLWLGAGLFTGGLVAAFVTLPLWISLFIYRPASLADTDPAHWGLNAPRFIAFPANDRARLTGWWVPPPSSAAPVLLIVHGRSANISTRAALAARLAQDGFGMLLFDYRGYGASSGSPSERKLTEDTLSAYDWLSRQGISSSRIVILGQSLGNAPAAQAAVARPVGGLVLVSPFTGLQAAAAARYPWLPLQQLPWRHNRFDVASSVARLSRPVLLVASRTDGLVPFEESRRLAAVVARPRWLEANGVAHDGLLASVAVSGRLSPAIRLLLNGVGQGAPVSCLHSKEQNAK